MGKHTNNSNRNNVEPDDDDYELKVLIDKCNVCHSSCIHHGERDFVDNIQGHVEDV